MRTKEEEDKILHGILTQAAGLLGRRIGYVRHGGGTYTLEDPRNDLGDAFVSIAPTGTVRGQHRYDEFGVVCTPALSDGLSRWSGADMTLLRSVDPAAAAIVEALADQWLLERLTEPTEWRSKFYAWERRNSDMVAICETRLGWVRLADQGLWCRLARTEVES